MGFHSDEGHKGSYNDCRLCEEENNKYSMEVDRGPDHVSKSGCFIATAVYGEVMAPEVVTLRKFRDNTLKRYWIGRKFISIYYAMSPPVAVWLKTKPKLSQVVRSLLDRLIPFL